MYAYAYAYAYVYMYACAYWPGVSMTASRHRMLCCPLFTQGFTHQITTWSNLILRIRTCIQRSYAYAYGGMETALDNSVGAIFFMHTDTHMHMDKRRHSSTLNTMFDVLNPINTWIHLLLLQVPVNRDPSFTVVTHNTGCKWLQGQERGVDCCWGWGHLGCFNPLHAKLSYRHPRGVCVEGVSNQHGHITRRTL